MVNVRARAKLLASKERDRVAEKKRAEEAMANIPQKGPAVRASKPGATSGGAGVACVSRIPTSLHQVLPVGRLVSSPTPNSPAGKPLQPKGQPLSDEQRLHHQPGALSNGKSPVCVSPVPGRLPHKHPVGRLENAALHVSPVAKSPRDGQRLSKKRLRENCFPSTSEGAVYQTFSHLFWKHVLEGIEALPTTTQSPSRQQGTPNTGAHNEEESGDAALHGKGGCGPFMARGDSPQPPRLPHDVPISPVGPEPSVPSPDPGPLPVLHRRCAPWEQADHGSPGQGKGKDSASQESSLHGPRSASSGSEVAVPLPDSPAHYTEAGPSTSGSPDSVRPPMVTRRRRPGGRPTLATPPDHSMLRFTELLASSPADMLPHGDFHGQEEAVEENEGSLASPWYLFSESSQHSPALDQSPLPAKSPLSEPADKAGGSSNAAGRAFKWAIPLAPLPLDSSSPVLSSLHRQPLHHKGPCNTLSTVPEVTETTTTTLSGKRGTSTALEATNGVAQEFKKFPQC